MRYGFLNNFSQALAADLAAADTTMTLDAGADNFASASPSWKRYKLTLFDGDGNLEIIDVKSETTGTLSIERGVEGTTPRDWPTGTTVEARLTAEVAGGFPWFKLSDNTHYQAVALHPKVSSEPVATGNACFVGGYQTDCSGDYSISLGYYADTTGNYSVNLGQYSYAYANEVVIVGYYASANQDSATALGSRASANSLSALAAGHRAFVGSGSNGGMALGAWSDVYGLGSVAIGHYAETYGDGQVAIGPRAYPNQIVSAFDLTAIPTMRASIAAKEDYQHRTAMRVSLPAAYRTSDVDLSTTGDKDNLDLPANTRLMVDRIEAVVISSAESGSTPTISIGTSLSGAEILSGHVMAGDTVLSREQLVSTPVAEAVSALYFKVDTAAAAAMDVRFVVHGYVMEI